jgi:hypothetical protein
LVKLTFSLALITELAAVIIGDGFPDALGADASCVEEVRVLAAAPSSTCAWQRSRASAPGRQRKVSWCASSFTT